MSGRRPHCRTSRTRDLQPRAFRVRDHGPFARLQDARRHRRGRGHRRERDVRSRPVGRRWLRGGCGVVGERRAAGDAGILLEVRSCQDHGRHGTDEEHRRHGHEPPRRPSDEGRSAATIAAAGEVAHSGCGPAARSRRSRRLGPDAAARTRCQRSSRTSTGRSSTTRPGAALELGLESIERASQQRPNVAHTRAEDPGDRRVVVVVVVAQDDRGAGLRRQAVECIEDRQPIRRPRPHRPARTTRPRPPPCRSPAGHATASGCPRWPR